MRYTTFYKCISRTFSAYNHQKKTQISEEKNSCWKYGLIFDNIMSPAVQIHHNEKLQWVTPAKLDGEIYVLDRMSNSKLTFFTVSVSLFVRHWLNLITVHCLNPRERSESSRPKGDIH